MNVTYRIIGTELETGEKCEVSSGLTEQEATEWINTIAKVNGGMFYECEKE
jgi:hypothetical protein